MIKEPTGIGLLATNEGSSNM